jgi:hypothetical protein
MRDVFYYGEKPNVHPKEKFATSIEDARSQSTTEHFWIINEYCDYRNFDWDFDFEFLPDEDVWAEDHNNVWPSQHQKDSGTWLCSKKNSDIIIYRADVDPVIRKNIKNDHWVLLDLIDENKFDFSWHPDPTDPPYIYVWGNQWHSGKIMPTVKYSVLGATEVKYIENNIAILAQLPENFDIFEEVDNFDFSWHPNPTSPPYIYVWGNQWNKPEDKTSIQYRVDDATEYNYMAERAIRKPCKDNWITPDNVDTIGFDFSWEPSPADQPYIYQFGTQWQKTGGPQYLTPGVHKNSDVKYVDLQNVKMLPNKDNFIILDNIVVDDFDYSWHSDETEEPYIYVFGNNLYAAEIMPTIQYVPKNAVRLASGKPIGQIKYVNDLVAKLGEDRNNWVIHQPIDETKFDFSWVPNPKDPPYIYVWGNKYISNVYKPTIEYRVEGATETKYMDDNVIVVPEFDRWYIPNNIDDTGFDYTWRPDPLEPNLIWQFGTQWQKTGGPRYSMLGATEVKYVSTQKVKALPNQNWTIPKNIDSSSFDFSWHPDDTSPPYIYRFPTQWAVSGGPIYTVVGATEVKYIDTFRAKALPSIDNWEFDSNNIDSSIFDFSWHPYAEDEPFIYQFGTQWQKTGGPRYLTPGVHKNSPVKYIDTRIIKAKRLPNKNNFIIIDNNVIDNFDYSWHPDETEEPFVYIFGNTQYPAEIMPTIKYVVEGATEIKYVNDIIATLGENKTYWEMPEGVNIIEFDFSWVPNPKDPAYIYEFGTQWNDRGGPKYVPPNKGLRLASGKLIGQYKYVSDQIAILGENKTNWIIPNNIDITGFDFSWVPHPDDPPYVYEFGTQWQQTGGPKYIVENATEVKYVDILKVRMLPNRDNWEVSDNIDSTKFDFSWHPNSMEEPYTYKFGTQWQKTGGPSYLTPGIHKNSPVKYIDTQVLSSIRLPNKDNFTILDNIIVADFDYSWHPDETEEPYVYVFGNNYYPAEIMPTIQYVPENVVRAASGIPIGQIKYVNDLVAKLGRNKTNWVVHQPIDETKFDFSWVPNPKDPPYIYVWGNKYISNIYKPTLEYISSEIPRLATGKPIGQIKYMDNDVEVLPEWDKWVIHQPVDETKFDFTWRPDPLEPAYIYVWGNKYIDGRLKPTLEYIPSDIPRLATGRPIGGQVKYMEELVEVLPEWDNWIIPEDIDKNSFDFTWRPDPREPDFIYQFGTQHQKTGGPQYITLGISRLATGKPIGGQVKYIDGIKTKKLPNKNHWTNPSKADVSTFDFSWHPDDTAPAYIYQFGTLLDREDGPRYMPPKTNGVVVYLERIEKEIEEVVEEIVKDNFPKYYITTTLDDLVKQHPNEMFWALNPDLDYSEFDFDWRPNIDRSQYESEYVHVFGSSESEKTQTYLVNSSMWEKGFRELNWVVDKKLDDETLFKMFKKSDMFFVDRSNVESQARFEQLKIKFPNIQKTRYLNSWVDTINRCINRASSNLCWILNSELNYTNFDFDYYPNPWQMKMVHVFGTQWSHWGTTFMVNRESFAEDTKWIKIIEHLSNLNFVKDRIAIADNNVYDIYVVDHGNKETAKVVDQLTNKACGKSVNTIKYTENYLLTFRNLLGQLPEKKEHYIWLCSSICDYSNFDFSYICDPFAREQLHVFPSDKQKLGDTFLVNINKFRKLIDNMTLLNEYNKINYNQHQTVKRLDPPTIITNYDSHVLSVMEDFDFPYAVFLSEDNKDLKVTDEEPISLWSSDTKNIVITSTGGTRIIVPKEAKNYVDTQLYDYPYIKKASRLVPSNVLDIVFLSNGEPNADENYENLLKLTRGLPNKITRIEGINGRAAAYHKTAEASNTNWYFVVWGKLFVNPKFDWSWHPDRLQIPKNYIFHAKNPLNGLVYGHQAVVAYNKKLALSTKGNQLDFTMESPHQVVPILSGTANYNSDAWTTWRTAFRECIKLRYDNTEESKNRLKIWLTTANGNFADFSIQGANDAIEYFDSVDGEYSKLKLSYEWDWLREKFQKFD